MADGLPFTKMHGCENDYVVIDAGRHALADPAALARAMADRRAAVGCDGVLLVSPDSDAAFRMRMFNPDGSEAEMCGNGLRCAIRFAHDEGIARTDVEPVAATAAGPRPYLEAGPGAAIHVDMGRPVLVDAVPERLDLGERTLVVLRIDMGNPHAVSFVEDVASYPLADVGPRVERHAAFPQRTNFEIVAARDARTLEQRTWERGAGETRACGTGACAAAVAAALDGRAAREVDVHLPGGVLHVRWAEDDRVWLSGPVVRVFDGVWRG